VQSYKNQGLQASGMVIKNQLRHGIVTNSRDRIGTLRARIYCTRERCIAPSRGTPRRRYTPTQ